MKIYLSLIALTLAGLSLQILASSKSQVNLPNNPSIHQKIAQIPSKATNRANLHSNFLQFKMKAKTNTHSKASRSKTTASSTEDSDSGSSSSSSSYGVISQYTTTSSGNVSASYVGPTSSDIAAETLETVEAIVETLKSETNSTLEAVANYSATVQNEMNETLTEAFAIYEETVEDIKDSVIEATEEELEHLREAEAIIEERIDEIKSKVLANEQQTDQLQINILESQIADFKNDLKSVKRKLSGARAKVDAVSVCGTFTDCTTCAAYQGCGWCTVEQKCVEGDEYGPLTDICSFYSYGSCNGADCASLTSCDTCIANSNCGWCADHRVNASACMERPANYSGCPENDWFHSLGENTICEALPYLQKLSAQVYNDTTIAESDEDDEVEETSPIPVQANAVKRKNQDILLDLEFQADTLNTKINELQSEVDALKAEIASVDTSSSASTSSLLEVQKNKKVSKKSAKRNKRSHLMKKHALN